MKRTLLLLAVTAVTCLADNILIKKLEASSTLPNQGKNSYDVVNLLDGDVGKVWAATFKGEPLTIEIDVEAYAVSSIELTNGYRRDKKSYESNSRVKTMKVYINSRDRLVKTFTFKNFGWSPYLNRYSETGEAYAPVMYSEKISFPTQTDVQKVILEITDIYPGKKWKDVCLGTIGIMGYVKNPVMESYKPEAGTMTDPRDNKTYKTLKMGDRTWLAENLSYNAKGSYCYSNPKAKECDPAGRLYPVSAARSGVCPAGWHMATKKEFEEMNSYLAEFSTGGSVELSYREAFAQGVSLNSFGLNYYTLEMCQCYDAGCDGDVDETEQGSIDLYLKYHPEREIDYKTGFWTEPTEYDWTSCGFEGKPELNQLSYIRYGSFWGGPNFHHDQCNGDERCLEHAVKGECEGAKELFVRCVKD